jgi:Lon protease-like protein
MPGLLMPLFPLSVVLLPGTPLPLHIFEERYKEMIGIAIADKSEFGVVLARDGGIVNIGCTASVDDVVRRYPDGRLDLIAKGRRRFHIAALDEEKAYLRAEVEFFDDEDDSDVPVTLRQQAIEAFKRLQEIEDEDDEGNALSGDDRLSFQLAQIVKDLEHRQTILAMRSEKERLLFLLQSLPAYAAKRERIALAKRVGPTNGHAKHYKEKT